MKSPVYKRNVFKWHKTNEFSIGCLNCAAFSSNFSSNQERVNAGVLQGSFLGPFLFLLYINDICDDLDYNIRIFADDTSLYAIVENGATHVVI